MSQDSLILCKIVTTCFSRFRVKTLPSFIYVCDYLRLIRSSNQSFRRKIMDYIEEKIILCEIIGNFVMDDACIS